MLQKALFDLSTEYQWVQIVSVKNINSMLIYEHNHKIRKALWEKREKSALHRMRMSCDTAAIEYFTITVYHYWKGENSRIHLGCKKDFSISHILKKNWNRKLKRIKQFIIEVEKWEWKLDKKLANQS